jgi:SAM-dependent methyltransferase
MRSNLNIFYPNDKDVLDFISKFDLSYNKKLSNYFNFSRVVILSDFHRLISEMKKNNFQRVAVVSGSLDEPELKLINYDSVDILSYKENNSFNLDDDWKDNNNNFNLDFSQESSKYDFVFCNQVLEHICSPIQGIKNIHYITKKNSYAFISIPTINCIHGEPHFYSAGYHPRYLDRICREAGFQVLHIGAWGSRKYLAYAVQGSWLTHDGLKPGFRSKFDFVFPYFAISDGRKKTLKGWGGVIITDTWALIKKI